MRLRDLGKIWVSGFGPAEPAAANAAPYAIGHFLRIAADFFLWLWQGVPPLLQGNRSLLVGWLFLSNYACYAFYALVKKWIPQPRY